MHSHWMRRAITLAKRGIGRTHPNPRVGAVVVQHGKIIGEGWHQQAGGPHAEVHAINAAGEHALGATLYVSLEPCAAHGRTPPCTELILKRGISHVYYASSDANPQMQGGGHWLAQQGICVEANLLQQQADDINRPFFHYIKHGLPYVIAKAAISLDGKLATRSKHAQWISGPESRRHAHRMRAQADAIIIGAATLRHDNPSLNIRDTALRGPAPLRVVIANHLPEFIPQYKLLTTQQHAGPVRFYIQQPRQGEEPLEGSWLQAGVEIVYTDGLKAALSHLAQGGYLQIIIEGGGKLHASFFEQQLSNELHLYQAPCLIGGKESVNLWHGVGINTMPEAPQLTNIQRRKLGQDQLIQGYLRYPKKK